MCGTLFEVVFPLYFGVEVARADLEGGVLSSFAVSYVMMAASWVQVRPVEWGEAACWDDARPWRGRA